MSESLFSNLGEHATILFAGLSGMGFFSHMVNTFPVPQNQYARWLLGGAQWITSHTDRAKNTIQGMDTVTTAVPKQMKDGTP